MKDIDSKIQLDDFVHREQVGKCDECTTDQNCGYCLSTLTCMTGNSNGPAGGTPCPNWLFNTEKCPGKFFYRNFSSPPNRLF